MNNYYKNPILQNDNFDNIDKSILNNDLKEQKYIENIIKSNIGKIAKVYISIPNSTDLHSKVFEGIIEQVGTDHIIISSPTTGEYFLVPIIYLCYIAFNETINY